MKKLTSADAIEIRERMETACRSVVLSLGCSDLARGLGIKRQSVHKWKIVPSKRALAVEAISGISRHELRPDIFGPAEAA